MYLGISVNSSPRKSCLNLSFYYRTFVFLVELYLSTLQTNGGNLLVMHNFLVSTHSIFEK